MTFEKPEALSLSELLSHQAEYIVKHHKLLGHTKNKEFMDFCECMEIESVCTLTILNLINDNKTTVYSYGTMIWITASKNFNRVRIL